MTPDSVDWHALDRLRLGFLSGAAGRRDYWQSVSDLASYDATFAQRIGWKWDFVLGDLRSRGWQPPAGELLDWGCGTGIASRAFVDHVGSETVKCAHFHDRSTLAMAFAMRRFRERFPAIPISAGAVETPSVLLLSHVLTELEPSQIDELIDRARASTAVLWVEPGTHEASRALIRVRERLRSEFHPVAPCPHADVCGMLAQGNERHWCHHFATPPPEVFADPFWVRFGKLLEVDLRSLPLSYLVLDRRAVPALPSGSFRIVGRPRISKTGCRFFACDARGVREQSRERRDDARFWKDARKGRLASLHSPGRTQSPASP